jgi:tektin-3
VHDHVEKSLLVETDNLRTCQEKLNACHSKINQQLANLRSSQFALEDDLTHKESAIGDKLNFDALKALLIFFNAN